MWVSVGDGTRTPPDLEDRAARYDRRHNLLTVSADFRGYLALIERWVKRYPRVPGARRAIEDLIGGWWQQALEETVLGVLALKGSEYWDERAVQAGLSEEALTASAMQRYHVDAVARRDLGALLAWRGRRHDGPTDESREPQRSSGAFRPEFRQWSGVSSRRDHRHCSQRPPTGSVPPVRARRA